MRTTLSLLEFDETTRRSHPLVVHNGRSIVFGPMGLDELAMIGAIICDAVARIDPNLRTSALLYAAEINAARGVKS